MICNEVDGERDKVEEGEIESAPLTVRLASSASSALTFTLPFTIKVELKVVSMERKREENRVTVFKGKGIPVKTTRSALITCTPVVWQVSVDPLKTGVDPGGHDTGEDGVGGEGVVIIGGEGVSGKK